MYLKPRFIASTRNTTFWWALQTQGEWVIFEPARTHHFSLKAQKFENPIFTFECFSFKAVYNSCKLQRLLQVAKFLLMYSFTHTNIVFSFTYLLKCSSSQTFVTRRNVSVLIVFPSFTISFCLYSTYIFDFMWSSNKVFKDVKIFWRVHSRPFVRYQGKNLDLFWIWCCFQFFLHCLVQPNQDMHFLLHVIFIIRIRL